MDQVWTGNVQAPMMPAYYEESQHPPFEGSLYSQGDLPPRVLQQTAQRNCSLDTSPMTPETDRFGVHHMGLTSQHHPAHHADHDSGIDVSYPGLPSDLSQNSTSSTTMPVTSHQRPVAHDSLPMSEMQSQAYSQSRAKVPYLPQTNLAHAETWPNMDATPDWDQNWSSYLPPAVRYQYHPIEGSSSTKQAAAPMLPGPHGLGHSNGIDNAGGASRKTSTNISLVSNNASSLLTSQHNDVPPRFKKTNQFDPTVPAHYDPTMEDPEDDYFDVTSDDEDEDPDHIMSGTPASTVGSMLAPAAYRNGRGFRSLTNFLNEPNVLASYRPSYSASPLMDPQTARVFCHYVTATAPTLSLHNRHPVNPLVMFTGEPVPAFQRSLFTYTLPMLALSNQGLLHAQLALASLHIAKLQQTSTAPSLRHYHYALRRVAKAVGHPTKRREVATLAATLLLGYFEITTAEHNKWNSHLAGARELILEIDFSGMTKRISAYKAETNMIKKGGMYDYRHGGDHKSMSFDILRTDKELDENLINIITGWKTQRDDYGHVIELGEPPSHYHVPLTPKDVETFEIQCDLFWWYAKQDMYRSLISGNRLL